jgi:hypothetical protein
MGSTGTGTVYHVINRGTARQATFLQEQDYEAFLKTLAEAHVLWGVEVFAYLSANSCKGCIMLTPSISTAAIARSATYSKGDTKRLSATSKAA